jgi:hypothetical protein
MENKLIKSDSFEIYEKGNDLIEHNDFFKDLVEIMENEKFSKFFEKYFKNMTEVKISVVYMKLYQEFKNRWKEMTEEELDKKVNVFLLWKMMRDRKMNKFALNTVLNHLDNPKKVNIFENLKEFVEFTENEMKLKDSK